MFVTEAGNGVVQSSDGGYGLRVPFASQSAYSNAQITSYRSKHEFQYQPPVRLTLRAKAMGALQGTAGFGFWNHPFAPGERGVRLPRAAWFFHASDHSNMALAKDQPGSGWKAATFDATGWQFLSLVPLAPIGVLLMRIPLLYRRLWPIGQRAIGVSERHLDRSMLDETHHYGIVWEAERIIFMVDDAVIHECAFAIAGPLGFIAWVDNQYAVVTPQGRFGFGLVEARDMQGLAVEDIRIEQLLR